MNTESAASLSLRPNPNAFKSRIFQKNGSVVTGSSLQFTFDLDPEAKEFFLFGITAHQSAFFETVYEFLNGAALMSKVVVTWGDVNDYNPGFLLPTDDYVWQPLDGGTQFQVYIPGASANPYLLTPLAAMDTDQFSLRWTVTGCNQVIVSTRPLSVGVNASIGVGLIQREF